MKIAIIDSGINQAVFPDLAISQYRIYSGKVYEEKAVDYFGHGTAVASILVRNITCELISICPGINEEGITDKMISDDDIICAMELAVEKEADILNISMGTTMFFHRWKMEQICQRAYQRGSVVFCAEATNGMPSLPWSCKHVVRVRSVGKSDQVVKMARQGFVECEVGKKFYRILTKEGKKFFATGSSYAVPYIINELIAKDWDIKIESIPDYLEFHNEDKILFREMIQQEIKLATCDPTTLFPRREYGRLVLTPFIKEMHSLIRFSGDEGFCKVVSVIDSNKKGLIDKDAGVLTDGCNREIRIYGKIEDVAEEADTLVIGYVDRLKKYDSNFEMERILSKNLEYKKWNVFSFIPVEEYWLKRYEQEGLHIYSPNVIDADFFNVLDEALPYTLPMVKPVVGIFGTTSSQGKFTLQLQMRKSMTEQGVKTFFLSTEHQGELLGADFVYADGYQNGSIMKISLEDRIVCLNKIMQYADKCTDCDLVIVGNQSRLIPYNAEEHTFMRSAVLLEGTRPDYAFVVVNPYTDPDDYVRNTIAALDAIYRCKTIALAFSDTTNKVNEEGKFIRCTLTKDEKEKIANKYEERFQLPCGCITDEEYIRSITDILLKMLT